MCLRQNRPRQPSEARRRPVLEALRDAPRRPTPTPTLRRLRLGPRAWGVAVGPPHTSTVKGAGRCLLAVGEATRQ